jgi:hypothetical protein
LRSFDRDAVLQLMFIDSTELRFRELHVDCFNTVRVARCLSEHAKQHSHVTIWPPSIAAIIAAIEPEPACAKTSWLLPRQNDEHEHCCTAATALDRKLVNVAKIASYAGKTLRFGLRVSLPKARHCAALLSIMQCVRIDPRVVANAAMNTSQQAQNETPKGDVSRCARNAHETPSEEYANDSSLRRL